MTKVNVPYKFVRGDEKQPRIAVIFRGKGKRIRQNEKDAWHLDIDVYWQNNPWADKKFSVDWVNGTLSDAVKVTNHFVLFVDNLTAQQTDVFKMSVADIGDLVWYGLANATDQWQVIDVGLAQILKKLTGQKWLERENADM